jgi:uncharacterized iron-regulated membrane protein
MKPVPPAEAARRSRVPRAVLALHRSLALGIGVLILSMSLTGGTLVLHHDIERLLFPERHLVGKADLTSTRERVPLAPVVQQLAGGAPAGYRPLRIEPALSSDETDKVIFVAPDGRTRWSAYVHPYTGAVVWQGPDQALFTPWLLHWHMNFRLGPWGHVLTSFVGACLVLLGVTGLIVHRDRLAVLARRPMRLDLGWRVAVNDLHRWLGLAGIYFSLVLGLTGSIYAFTVARKQIPAPKPPAPAFDLAQLAPLEPALAAARERFPGGEFSRIIFPSHATAPLTLRVLHRDAPVWRKFSRMDFDPATGAVRAIHDAREASAADKFSSMLSPLHFGFYGSPLVKWLYAIGGFTPALLMLSGTAMWYLRTRKACATATLPSRPVLATSTS